MFINLGEWGEGKIYVLRPPRDVWGYFWWHPCFPSCSKKDLGENWVQVTSKTPDKSENRGFTRFRLSKGTRLLNLLQKNVL